MRPLAFFYEGKPRFLDPLVQVVSLAKAPVFVYGVPRAPSLEALRAMEALGVLGAAFEGPGLSVFPLGSSSVVNVAPSGSNLVAPARSGLEGVVVDAEGQAAGVLDLVYPVRGVLRGQFAFGVALDRLLSAHAGARALWVGQLLFPMAPFLRALGEVSVYAPSYAEGEAFLARLPGRVRGQVVLRPEEAQAFALRVDLLIYGGGVFPLSLVQPFHLLLAFAEPGERVRGLVGQTVGEELPFLWAQAVLEALGFGGGR